MHKNANCGSDNCKVLKEPVWGRGIQPEHQEEATQWQNYTESNMQVHLNLTTSMILSSMHEVSLCTNMLDLLQFNVINTVEEGCVYTLRVTTEQQCTISSSNKKLTDASLSIFKLIEAMLIMKVSWQRLFHISKLFCQSHFLLHFQILWINVAVSSTRA